MKAFVSGQSGVRSGNSITMRCVDCKTVRIFAYSSTREQSNEAENRERDYGRVRLARFARVRLLRHALPISLLILRKKPDCFAVYVLRGERRFFTYATLIGYLQTLLTRNQWTI